MTFSDILNALKTGQRAARAGWNGKGLCVFLKAGSAHGPYFGVPLGTELAADNPLTIDGVSAGLFCLDAAQDTAIRLPHLCLCYPTGTSVAWAPSQTDLLASDWAVLPSLGAMDEPTEGLRRGILSVFASNETFITEQLKRVGVTLIRRELYDLGASVALVIEHPSLDVVAEGARMPRYVVIEREGEPLEFRKYGQ